MKQKNPPQSVDEITKDRKSFVLYEDQTGKIIVPAIPHKDRAYGGHLMIKPNVNVNHMHELYLQDRNLFNNVMDLCAITEMAILSIPIMNGELTEGRVGVVNSFEAGNWGMHTYRKPYGILKDASSKSFHIHYYGRSTAEPSETEEDKILHWGWGEAMRFPEFMDTPYSPPDETKKWTIPEQFNTEEREFLTGRIKELAEKHIN